MKQSTTEKLDYTAKLTKGDKSKFRKRWSKIEEILNDDYFSAPMEGKTKHTPETRWRLMSEFFEKRFHSSLNRALMTKLKTEHPDVYEAARTYLADRHNRFMSRMDANTYSPEELGATEEKPAKSRSNSAEQISSVVDFQKQVTDTLHKIEPNFAKGAPVSVWELKNNLPNTENFNENIRKLTEQGVVNAAIYDEPDLLSEEKRRHLIPIGNDRYVGFITVGSKYREQPAK